MEAYKFHQFPNHDPITNLKINIGDKKYLQLVLQYGEPPKITSPISQRKIGVNKVEYKKLIKSGYTDDQLLYPAKSNEIIMDDMTDDIINNKIDIIKIDDIINKMTKLSISKDNVFFGHLLTYILKDKLYCIGKNTMNNVICCCPTLLNLYVYINNTNNTDNGLYYIDSTMHKINFNHPVKSMKYSFGYVFILTENNELFIYHDYVQEFISITLNNVSLISSCSTHILLLIDNRVYILPHHLYTDFKIDELDYFTFNNNVVKISASKRGDLILTKNKLYGIKDNEKWLLNIDNVIDISSSDYHDMILTTTELVGFGDNSSGQLGQCNKFYYDDVCKIDIPNGTTRVYCGRHSTIIYNGNYYGFGDNTNKSLGIRGDGLKIEMIKF
jgi:hypothetical protein